MTKTAAEARKILNAALSLKARVEVRETIVSVTINFRADDKGAFMKAEDDAASIIDAIPARGGSTWGTTSDGVGGYVALKSGTMTLNKSGCSKRIAAELAKLTA